MKMNCGISCMSSCKNAKDWALLALRIALGVIFIFHGYDKLWGGTGMTAFTGLVASIGFPVPTFFAYVAALSEFFGGIALLVGVGTCIASSLLAIIMLVSILGLKGIHFPAIDADLALLAMSIAILLMGSGSYSLSAMCCNGCGSEGASCCSKEGGKTPKNKK